MEDEGQGWTEEMSWGCFRSQGSVGGSDPGHHSGAKETWVALGLPVRAELAGQVDRLNGRVEGTQGGQQLSSLSIQV